MSPVTITASPTIVTISWTPITNPLVPVLEYRVKILNKNTSVYTEYKTLCNPITASSCTGIPMTNFTEYLNYTAGEVLKA